MRNQTFGIEIEMTGLTRYEAATTIAAYFGTTEYYRGGTYSTYEVKDQTGRVWKLMSDASIRAEKKGRGIATTDHRVELVSPICRYGDIETIQELVRELRKAGMMVNETTGIHVHIGANGHTARSLKKHSKHNGKQRRPAVPITRGKKRESREMVQEGRR